MPNGRCGSSVVTRRFLSRRSSERPCAPERLNWHAGISDPELNRTSEGFGGGHRGQSGRVAELLDSDPFEAAGLVTGREIRQWSIRVDPWMDAAEQ